MPVVTPSGIQFFISDLVNEVLLRTENRTGVTDAARAAIWIRDALIELTMDPELRNEFDELEVLGPIFNLTGGLRGTFVQEYPFSSLLQPGDYNVATLNIRLWTDPPANTNVVRLNDTSYQDSDRISPFPGLPTKWYRFNDTVGFTPPPDQNYQVQARAYKMHPINDNVLTQTQILIGRDWNEVLIWAAVMRGYMELEQYEKAASIKQMLFGDPEYPQRPGLIAGRKHRREKESWRRQTALRPIYRPYSSRR